MRGPIHSVVTSLHSSRGAVCMRALAHTPAFPVPHLQFSPFDFSAVGFWGGNARDFRAGDKSILVGRWC